MREQLIVSMVEMVAVGFNFTKGTQISAYNKAKWYLLSYPVVYIDLFSFVPRTFMVFLLLAFGEQGNTCLNSICGFEFVRYKRTIVQCYFSFFSDSRYVQTVCVIWIRTKGFMIFCPKLWLLSEKYKCAWKPFKVINNTHQSDKSHYFQTCYLLLG